MRLRQWNWVLIQRIFPRGVCVIIWTKWLFLLAFLIGDKLTSFLTSHWLRWWVVLWGWNYFVFEYRRWRGRENCCWWWFHRMTATNWLTLMTTSWMMSNASIRAGMTFCWKLFGLLKCRFYLFRFKLNNGYHDKTWCRSWAHHSMRWFEWYDLHISYLISKMTNQSFEKTKSILIFNNIHLVIYSLIYPSIRSN